MIEENAPAGADGSNLSILTITIDHARTDLENARSLFGADMLAVCHELRDIRVRRRNGC